MNFYIQVVLLLSLCHSVSGQNNTLDFDGDDDYIWHTPINGLPSASVSNFTVEMSFITHETSITPGTCATDFRRLFALGDATNLTLFEVGECNGYISVFWFNASGGNLVQMTTSIRDNQWHCLSVVRSSSIVEVFLDGNLELASPVSGTHNINTFTVGHGLAASLFNYTPGADWSGRIDEVKLWSTALTPSQLTACSSCQLSGAESNLVLYWQFDQGIPGGTNTNISQIIDSSPNGNDGDIFLNSTPPHDPFALSGIQSNFVSSGIPLVYPKYDDLTLFISDPQLTVGLVAICDNEPVYFTLSDPNGNIPTASSGVTTIWQYNDVVAGSPLWNTTTLTGFQFVVPSGEATLINCPDPNGNEYVIREYRAIISVTNQFGTCRDTTPPVSLQIYCKVTHVDVVISNPLGPLCEGDLVTFNVSLLTNVSPPNPGVNDVHIDWCLIDDSGTHLLPGFQDMMSFTYPATGSYTVGTQNICFKATVSNGACPSLTDQECIQVDLNPICGYIVGLPYTNPANLTLTSIIPWLTYEICPGNDATIGFNPNTLPPFTNCNAQWQYSFIAPPNAIWNPMGFSNPAQNTNLLPAHYTPAWPSGQTNIFYQVQCNPLTTPSGCDPCLSNIIEIRLKPPLAKPIVSIDVPFICNDGFSFATVSVTPVDPLVTQYTWYCNGLVIGYGDHLPVTNEACYWVEATDGCSTIQSDKVCLKVCTAVAIMTCPQDNPCVIPNIPITICADLSYSTCGPIVSYLWGWDGGIYVGGQHTSCLVHIPDPNGTNYTLTVTDSFGCTHTITRFIKPCQP